MLRRVLAQYAQFPQQIVTELLLFARHRVRTSEIKETWICVVRGSIPGGRQQRTRDREGE